VFSFVVPPAPPTKPKRKTCTAIAAPTPEPESTDGDSEDDQFHSKVCKHNHLSLKLSYSESYSAVTFFAGLHVAR
jgi:hypothetical protein